MVTQAPMLDTDIYTRFSFDLRTQEVSSDLTKIIAVRYVRTNFSLHPVRGSLMPTTRNSQHSFSRRETLFAWREWNHDISALKSPHFKIQRVIPQRSKLI
jgi:hypothetical protein